MLQMVCRSDIRSSQASSLYSHLQDLENRTKLRIQKMEVARLA